MHDWSLVSVTADWASGTVEMNFNAAPGSMRLIAHNCREFGFPRRHPWGPSVSVNTVTGPRSTDSGMLELLVEMQTGDVIRIVASRFEMPSYQ